MDALKDRLYTAAVTLQNILVKNAPKDTWNLARNGIWVLQENGTYWVCVGGENARYAVYTNEPWTEGRNPNEGWIPRSIEEALPTITAIMQGDISEEELKETNEQLEKEIARQQEERIRKILNGGRL